MIRIRDISLFPGYEERDIKKECAKVLGLSLKDIKEIRLVKKSLDARKKNDIKFNITADVLTARENAVLDKNKNPKISKAVNPVYVIPGCRASFRPVIAGFGPAGMFAALVLSIAGLRPIVFERGADVDSRIEKTKLFFEKGILDTECNVQFGEGGAGTFSDGKLTTGIRNERIFWVLKAFCDAGAHDDILYESKPHIGTDILTSVVKNIRKVIIDNGGEVHFNSLVSDIKISDGVLSGITVKQGGAEKHMECRELILAIGHSARDTFEMLRSAGVDMQQKAFSVGARIEHKQKFINDAQFGPMAEKKGMPVADYKLSCHTEKGSVYTFCMCPGGYVVAAASEEGGVVTNGMSKSDRAGENANSAVLVSVSTDDFPDKGVLSGMYMQREIERAAYRAGGNSYCAVSQLVGDFMQGKKSEKAGDVTPTYRPGTVFGDIADVLPKRVVDAMRSALTEFDKKIKGFASPDSVLTAPETRSSSPVRLVRNDERCTSVAGLYACGEGSGYAGGIMSAAVDGMMTAEAVMKGKVI